MGGTVLFQVISSIWSYKKEVKGLPTGQSHLSLTSVAIVRLVIGWFWATKLKLQSLIAYSR